MHFSLDLCTSGPSSEKRSLCYKIIYSVHDIHIAFHNMFQPQSVCVVRPFTTTCRGNMLCQAGRNLETTTAPKYVLLLQHALEPFARCGEMLAHIIYSISSPSRILEVHAVSLFHFLMSFGRYLHRPVETRVHCQV